MAPRDFYSAHLLDDEVARKAGFNPYYNMLQSALGDPIVINGKEYINLASNNYLGLSNDPAMIAAAVSAIREFGVSMCATPVAAGYTELFRQAEEAIARFTGLEDALIFPSCYQANNGLFQAIVKPEDLVIVDRFAHSSLVEGIRSAGCKCRPFRHNDMDHLEEILRHSAGYHGIFVVTESVFSTEGSIAPFARINELCSEYDAVPVIDDSHGIGVIGRNGKGILEHSGITGFGGVYTASLGKALATSGGVVAGKASLMRYLRFSTSHLIYSTAIMPAALKALIVALDILSARFDDLSVRLWDYSRMISEGLRECGYELTPSETPITAIRTGNSLQTLQLAKRMFDEGIFSTPFIHPSVPENDGRIRLIAGANLRPETIRKADEIFKKIRGAK